MLLKDAPRQAENGRGRDESATGRRGSLCARPRRLRARLLASTLTAALAPTLALGGILPTGTAEARGAPEDVAALYEEGRTAFENSEFDIAAEKFEAAYEAIPREELERRAAVLFELIEARVAAFSEDGRPSHLCDATRTLSEFLDDNTEIRGSTRSRDARKAKDLRETYADELDLIRNDNPDFYCEGEEPPPPEDVPPPETEPGATPPETPREPTQVVRLRDPLVASGVAFIGVGALLLGSATVGLGIGAHAESEGEWLLSSRPDLASDSPEAARLNTVGRQANLLAIIGGATGAVALGSGIALYMIGKRKQAASAPTLSFAPSLSPQKLGGGLSIRF